MAILGSLIKTAIDLRGALVTEKSPVESQIEILSDLLEKAKNTAFGKYYGFSKILESDDIEKTFSEKVPYFEYHQMHEKWWKRTQEGLEDITWPGKTPYFARSSGTTGKEPKRVPVTNEMVDAIQNAGIKQVGALANFDIPSDFFEKEILMLGSSTNMVKHEQFLEGEISGIGASNIPFWFRGFYKPGEDIALMEDWDEKVRTIAKRAREWDIGALSGIPSWVQLMLEEVIAYHGANNIHEIWPNLQVYTSGGVAFQPYQKSFERLLDHPITIIDTYFASEGFLAFQNRPDTMSMRLLTDNGIYFEFVPFKPEYINEDGTLSQDAPSLTLAQVEANIDYILIISTVSGTWRYLIGDTIAFTDVDKVEIKITGRTKFFLNVVGSQLSVNKMEVALREMEEKFNIRIPEFTVAAVRINDEFYHHWYLGSEDEVDSKEIAEALDEALKQANKGYDVARSKALKGVIVSIVPVDMFHEWNAKNKKKGGQVKMEKVMSEEKFAQWEDFVKIQQNKK